MISYPSNLFEIYKYDTRLQFVTSKFKIKENLYDTTRLGETF